MQSDEVETALASVVQREKAALLALLSPEEQKTRKIKKAEDRIHVWTFEDSASQIVSERTREDWPNVRQALKAYQHAVNAFWSRVYCDGTPERLYRQWSRSNRQLARMIPREDVEAEIVFGLREAIQNFDPTCGVPFRLFAAQMLIDGMRIITWARQQKTVVRRMRQHLREGVEFDTSFKDDNEGEADDADD